MSGGKVTMQSIAQRLGVSKVAVHKALRGAPDVSEALRDRILSAAAEMGYSAIDPLAKLCRNYKFLLPKEFALSTEQFYHGVFDNLEAKLKTIGCSLEQVVIGDGFSPTAFIKSVGAYGKGQTGYFIAGAAKDRTFVEFADSGAPVVCVDYYSESFGLNYVYLDNFRGSYFLTNYLFQLGHRKIGFVMDMDTPGTNLDKFFGYRKSLMQHAVPYERSALINRDFAKPGAAIGFALPSPLPSAFIADSDLAAYNFIIALTAKGLKVPDDVSVVSYDNTRLALESNPTITSLGMESGEITEACYNIMYKALLSGGKKKYTFTLHPSVHVRASSSPPKI